MRRALPLVLLLLAAPLGAQQAQPPAPPEPEKKEERRPLNLRLDNPSSFATTSPASKDKPKDLPGLGDDARRLPEAPPGTQGSPFPKDTSPMK